MCPTVSKLLSPNERLKLQILVVHINEKKMREHVKVRALESLIESPLYWMMCPTSCKLSASPLNVPFQKK